MDTSQKKILRWLWSYKKIQNKFNLQENENKNYYTPSRIIKVKNVTSKYLWTCGTFGNLTPSVRNIKWNNCFGKLLVSYKRKHTHTMTQDDKQNKTKWLMATNTSSKTFIETLFTAAPKWKQPKCLSRLGILSLC